MKYITNLSTVNFKLVLGNADTDGNVTVAVSPASDAGKALLRHKKWARGTELKIRMLDLGGLVDELEGKAAILASL